MTFYNLVYVNIYRWNSFIEDLRGGNSAKIKSLVLLSFLIEINIITLIFFLKNHNISFLYNLYSSNALISIIVSYSIIYLLHHIAYSGYNKEEIIIERLKTNKSLNFLSISITVLYFLLTIILLFIK
jgi:hypothetical protein